MRIAFHRISMVIAIVMVLLSWPKSASASDPALELYSGGNDPDGLAANQPTNNVFYDHTFTYSYSGGAICLSSKGDSCAPPAIDDAVGIFVDDVQVFYQESDTHDFGPVDFSGKLHVGINRIRVQLIDLMGPSRGGSALWLVPSNAGGNNCNPDCGAEGELRSLGYTGAMPSPCPPSSISFPFPDIPPAELPQIEWPGPLPVELSQAGYVTVREGPSLSSKGVADVGPGMQCTVDRSVLNEGYIWVHVTIPQGFIFGGQTTIPNGGQGWVAFEDANRSSPLSNLGTPQPPENQPSQTTVPVSSLPPDGPRSPSGFWCSLPGFCVQAAEVNTTCHPQCVETANSLRDDLPIWGSKATSDQILAVAQSQPTFDYHGVNLQVRVRNADEDPQAGDLVIWPSNCDYAWAGGGHIGYVTSANPFSITDLNWYGNCTLRTDQQINKLDCMRFITKPYPARSGAYVQLS